MRYSDSTSLSCLVRRCNPSKETSLQNKKLCLNIGDLLIVAIPIFVSTIPNLAPQKLFRSSLMIYEFKMTTLGL